jgi:hypothetical protein
MDDVKHWENFKPYKTVNMIWYTEEYSHKESMRINKKNYDMMQENTDN